MVSIGDGAANVTFLFAQNSDYVLSFTIKNDGSPVNISTWEIKFKITDSYKTERQGYTIDGSIISGPDGQFTLTLPRAITEQFTAPGCQSPTKDGKFKLGFGEIKVKNTTTDSIDPIMRGPVYVQQSTLEW